LDGVLLPRLQSEVVAEGCPFVSAWDPNLFCSLLPPIFFFWTADPSVHANLGTAWVLNVSFPRLPGPSFLFFFSLGIEFPFLALVCSMASPSNRPSFPVLVFSGLVSGLGWIFDVRGLDTPNFPLATDFPTVSLKKGLCRPLPPWFYPQLRSVSRFFFRVPLRISLRCLFYPTNRSFTAYFSSAPSNHPFPICIHVPQFTFTF